MYIYHVIVSNSCANKTLVISELYNILNIAQSQLKPAEKIGISFDFTGFLISLIINLQQIECYLLISLSESLSFRKIDLYYTAFSVIEFCKYIVFFVCYLLSDQNVIVA